MSISLRNTALVSISIPFLFLIVFGVYFLVIYPNLYTDFSGSTLILFNIKQLPYNWFIVVFGYLTLGVLMINTSLSLLLLEVEKTILFKIGLILTIISAMLWVSFGFTPITIDQEFNVDSFMYRQLGLFITSFFGFIFIATDSSRFLITKKFSTLLIINASLMAFISLVFGILKMEMNIISYFMQTYWLFYFSSYLILGLGILKSKNYTT